MRIIYGPAAVSRDEIPIMSLELMFGEDRENRMICKPEDLPSLRETCVFVFAD